MECGKRYPVPDWMMHVGFVEWTKGIWIASVDSSFVVHLLFISRSEVR